MSDNLTSGIERCRHDVFVAFGAMQDGLNLNCTICRHGFYRRTEPLPSLPTIHSISATAGSRRVKTRTIEVEDEAVGAEQTADEIEPIEDELEPVSVGQDEVILETE